MELHERLKNRRKKLSLTQEDVSEQILVSRQTISNWENGKTLPDINSLVVISDVYQISLDDLIKGDEKVMEKIYKDSKATVDWFSYASMIHGVLCLILLTIPNTDKNIIVLGVIVQCFFTSLLAIKGYNLVGKEKKIDTIEVMYFVTVLLGVLTPISVVFRLI